MLFQSLARRGVVISSGSYSGVISANSVMPKTMVLPAGTWLIVTSGYIAYDNSYHPFAVNLNYGKICKGMSPSCVVKLDAQSTISISNILGREATAVDLVLFAISL